MHKIQKGGIGGPHGGTIGEDDKDSMIGGDWIGTGSFGAKEINSAARVGNGMMRRVVGSERSNG